MKKNNFKYLFLGKKSKLSIKFKSYFKKNNYNFYYLDKEKIPRNSNLIIYNFVGSNNENNSLVSNFEYPKTILNKLLKNNNKIIWIQFSSMSVYAPNYETIRFINELEPESPKSIYGESKLKFDDYLRNNSFKNFSFFIFRIPSIDYYNGLKINFTYFYLSLIYKFSKSTVINHIKPFDIIKITFEEIHNLKPNQVYIISKYRYLNNFVFFNFYNFMKLDPMKLLSKKNTKYKNVVISYLCYRNIFKSKYSLIDKLFNIKYD